jgi:uncharacterized protein YbjT (DUF2867 family)
MTNARTVLITGITGKQGGATARHLAGHGFTIKGMSRHPDSDAAKALAGSGIEIVKGDLDDTASLEAALAGAWGVFAVQNTWEAGVEGEETQGKRVAEVARKAGVQHFVYTSVGSADRDTGIPHFDNKWRIEETVRSLGFPSTVILRPVFFMENLLSPWFMNGDTIYAAIDPATPLQMIAVDDIGRYAARAFIDAASLNGREIDLAGDAVTMPDAAATLGAALGRPIGFVRIPIEEVRKNSEDLALMLEWFDRVGYDVDIAALAREFGFSPMTLAAWAAKQK